MSFDCALLSIVKDPEADSGYISIGDQGDDSDKIFICEHRDFAFYFPARMRKYQGCDKVYKQFYTTRADGQVDHVYSEDEIEAFSRLY